MNQTNIIEIFRDDVQAPSSDPDLPWLRLYTGVLFLPGTGRFLRVESCAMPSMRQMNPYAAS